MLMENEHILGESSVRKGTDTAGEGIRVWAGEGIWVWQRSYFKDPNEKEFLWIYPKVKRQ